MGCYEINLGTAKGQKIHAFHLILLPLLPILILIAQNYSTFDFNKVRERLCSISMDFIHEVDGHFPPTFVDNVDLTLAARSWFRRLK